MSGVTAGGFGGIEGDRSTQPVAGALDNPHMALYRPTLAPTLPGRVQAQIAEADRRLTRQVPAAPSSAWPGASGSAFVRGGRGHYAGAPSMARFVAPPPQAASIAAEGGPAQRQPQIDAAIARLQHPNDWARSDAQAEIAALVTLTAGPEAVYDGLSAILQSPALDAETAPLVMGQVAETISAELAATGWSPDEIYQYRRGLARTALWTPPRDDSSEAETPRPERLHVALTLAALPAPELEGAHIRIARVGAAEGTTLLEETLGWSRTALAQASAVSNHAGAGELSGEALRDALAKLPVVGGAEVAHALGAAGHPAALAVAVGAIARYEDSAYRPISSALQAFLAASETVLLDAGVGAETRSQLALAKAVAERSQWTRDISEVALMDAGPARDEATKELAGRLWSAQPPAELSIDAAADHRLRARRSALSLLLSNGFLEAALNDPEGPFAVGTFGDALAVLGDSPELLPKLVAKEVFPTLARPGPDPHPESALHLLAGTAALLNNGSSDALRSFFRVSTGRVGVGLLVQDTRLLEVAVHELGRANGRPEEWSIRTWRHLNGTPVTDARYHEVLAAVPFDLFMDDWFGPLDTERSPALTVGVMSDIARHGYDTVMVGEHVDTTGLTERLDRLHPDHAWHPDELRSVVGRDLGDLLGTHVAWQQSSAIDAVVQKTAASHGPENAAALERYLVRLMYTENPMLVLHPAATVALGGRSPAMVLRTAQVEGWSEELLIAVPAYPGVVALGLPNYSAAAAAVILDSLPDDLPRAAFVERVLDAAWETGAHETLGEALDGPANVFLRGALADEALVWNALGREHLGDHDITALDRLDEARLHRVLLRAEAPREPNLSGLGLEHRWRTLADAYDEAVGAGGTAATASPFAVLVSEKLGDYDPFLAALVRGDAPGAGAVDALSAQIEQGPAPAFLGMGVDLDAYRQAVGHQLGALAAQERSQSREAAPIYSPEMARAWLAGLAAHLPADDPMLGSATRLLVRD